MTAHNWLRGDYLISTDPSLLQIKAINKALGSDAVWWAGELPEDALHEAVRNSLCLGIYHRPSPVAFDDAKPSSVHTRHPLEQVGLVRVITDKVTFAYLTDVYILESHQGKGLGRWALGILNDELRSWSHLRRVMLLTTDKMHLFNKSLSMKDHKEFGGMKGVSIAMVEGPGAQH
ncbi:hypothetical protein EDB80DRAFT_895880 [Ilyonectria destructans]|nr:hypothetical protein EDB80DRAFT_895880 [Ilyonectria destructans]